MKEVFVKDLRKDQEITDFFMAKTLAIKVGANGKKYLDILLADKTGEISGKRPHSEVGSGQIDSVRPIGHRHLQSLHVPRRGQQLRLVPLNRHRSCC